MNDFFTRDNIVKIAISTVVCLVIWALLDFLWATFIDHTTYNLADGIAKDLLLAVVTGFVFTYFTRDSKE